MDKEGKGQVATPQKSVFHQPVSYTHLDVYKRQRISREYPIGRIYDVLYLCRRWEDNSDASLDVVKMNNHNIYKDKIRTWELEARLNMERQ